MNKKKELLVQIMWELAGSIFYAIGIYNFALQAEFPMTGFSGISIILYRLFNISIGLSTVLLNIPVAILCCKLLGRKFLSAQYDACFCLLLLLTMLRRYFRCIRATDCLRHCAQVYFAE